MPRLNIEPSRTTFGSNNEDMDLSPDLLDTFRDENDFFFYSLYSRLDEGGDGNPLMTTVTTPLGPDLRFMVGEEKLEAHLFIMRHYCRDLNNVRIKEEKKDGREEGFFLDTVPSDLRVTPEAFRVFRKAIYLKKFHPPTFNMLVQVRRLAEHFGCDLVLQKCNQVKVTMRNSHILFDNWPRSSKVRKQALGIIKGNLKEMIEKDHCKNWTEKLWAAVLSLTDLVPPVPSEDELFSALLRWRERIRNRTLADEDEGEGKFRSLFKDLFQYSLMTQRFLLSKPFRESGILEPGEIYEILVQIEENEGSNCAKITSRRVVTACLHRPDPPRQATLGQTDILSSPTPTQEEDSQDNPQIISTSSSAIDESDKSNSGNGGGVCKLRAAPSALPTLDYFGPLLTPSQMHEYPPRPNSTPEEGMTTSFTTVVTYSPPKWFTTPVDADKANSSSESTLSTTIVVDPDSEPMTTQQSTAAGVTINGLQESSVGEGEGSQEGCEDDDDEDAQSDVTIQLSQSQRRSQRKRVHSGSRSPERSSSMDMDSSFSQSNKSCKPNCSCSLTVVVEGPEMNHLMKYSLKPFTKLNKLMNHYATRTGLAISRLRFLYSGMRICSDDTPTSLNLQDNDVIEVFKEQVG